MGELLNLKALIKLRYATTVIIFVKRSRTIVSRYKNVESEANEPKLLEQVRASSVVMKDVLHSTESLGEDVPLRLGAYIVPRAGTEARRFHKPVDDVESTVNSHDVTETSNPHFNFLISQSASLILENCSCIEICELLGKYEKRALSVFYLVLEAASFLLDIFGKSKRSILLAAFLLSAFGFAITMSTHTWTMRRTRAATRMHLQKRLLMVLEISFSLVQLIVTLIYFILAELGVKNRINTSVFPLVFAIIAAVFTFKYDGEVSDSSGLDSALAANNQGHMANTTRNEDPEANGSMPMLAIGTIDDSKKQDPKASVAYSRSQTI